MHLQMTCTLRYEAQIYASPRPPQLRVPNAASIMHPRPRLSKSMESCRWQKVLVSCAMILGPAPSEVLSHEQEFSSGTCTRAANSSGSAGLVRRPICTIVACHAADQRRDVVRVAVAEESGAGFSAAVDRRVPSLRLRDMADNLDLESRAASAEPRPRIRTGKDIEVCPNRTQPQFS